MLMNIKGIVKKIRSNETVGKFKREIGYALEHGLTEVELSEGYRRHVKDAIWLILYERYGLLSACANGLWSYWWVKDRPSKDAYISIAYKNGKRICKIRKENLNKILKKPIDYIYDLNQKDKYEMDQWLIHSDFFRLLMLEYEPYEGLEIDESINYEMKVMSGYVIDMDGIGSKFIPLKHLTIEKSAGGIEAMWKRAVYSCEKAEQYEGCREYQKIERRYLCTYIINTDTNEMITNPIYVHLFEGDHGHVGWNAWIRITGVMSLEQVTQLVMKRSIVNGIEQMLGVTPEFIPTKSGTIISLKTPVGNESIEFILSQPKHYKA